MHMVIILIFCLSLLIFKFLFQQSSLSYWQKTDSPPLSLNIILKMGSTGYRMSTNLVPQLLSAPGPLAPATLGPRTSGPTIPVLQ